MWLILASLAIGIVVGITNIIPGKCHVYLGKLTTAALFIMLAAMGAQMGINKELLSNISSLGWRALVIALMSVIGSATLIWLVCRGFDPSKTEGGIE